MPPCVGPFPATDLLAARRQCRRRRKIQPRSHPSAHVVIGDLGISVALSAPIPVICGDRVCTVEMPSAGVESSPPGGEQPHQARAWRGGADCRSAGARPSCRDSGTTQVFRRQPALHAQVRSASGVSVAVIEAKASIFNDLRARAYIFIRSHPGWKRNRACRCSLSAVPPSLEPSITAVVTRAMVSRW